MSPIALNYDSLATVHESVLCIYPIAGCTDSEALNYLSIANVDDGSCVPSVFGCTSQIALNYNSNATVLDDSCVFPVFGCTDSRAENFVSAAAADDGSCLITGCDDSLALNYVSVANVPNNALCSYSFAGCTNSEALNYASSATDDDGSCVILGCTDSLAPNYELSATANDGTCEPIVRGCTDSAAANFLSVANVDDSSCRYAGCISSNAVNYNPSATFNDGSCIVLGCTDSTKINYDSEATVDNFSCFDGTPACVDLSASNYVPLSPFVIPDDSLCIYTGCLNSFAQNFNPSANEDDGSCVLVRASGSVYSLGPMVDCRVFIDETEDYLWDEAFEPSSESDDAGFYRIIYPVRAPVLVLPSAPTSTCRDALPFFAAGSVGEFLGLPLQTLVDALVLTPLTTVGTFLVNRDGMTIQAASDKVYTGLGLASRNVWTFEAIEQLIDSLVTLSGDPLEAAIWIVRQWQVQQSIYCVLASLQLQFTSAENVMAVFSSLASMLFESSIPVFLADAESLFQLAQLTSDELDVSRSYDANFLAQCAASNAEYETSILGLFARRRRLSESRDESASGDSSSGSAGSGDPSDSSDEDALVVLCEISVALSPNPGVNCSNITIPEGSNAFGCTQVGAVNFDSLAYINAGCIFAGCTNSSATNYDPRASVDDSSCVASVLGCVSPSAINFNSRATVNDDSCIYQFQGCTDSLSPNFLSAANVDDGTCIPGRIGCIVPTAINYDSTATVNFACRFETTDALTPNSTCPDPLALNYDSVGTEWDADSCQYAVSGCTDSTAVNYLEAATEDDGSCVPSLAGCLSSQALNFDSLATVSDNGCVYSFVAGCTTPNATNFDSSATVDDGSCTFPLRGCVDSIALNYVSSAKLEGECEYAGCTESSAFNFDSSATVDDGSCSFPISVGGCSDSYADNYFSVVTVDDGSCQYPGCVDSRAFNFDSLANFNDGTCRIPGRGCGDSTASNYVPGSDGAPCRYGGCTQAEGTLNYDSVANYNDGTCRYSTEIAGCTDSAADNYESLATVPGDFCVYLGCTSPAAANYNSRATIDDGSCSSVIAGCTATAAVNYQSSAQQDDGSCIFDEVDPIDGCTNSLADNYNSLATPRVSGDELCEFGGCTQSAAPNYNSNATFDDGSCTPLRAGCTDSRADNYDRAAVVPCNATQADGNCSACEFAGCTQTASISYDSLATFDDGSCVQPQSGCTDSVADNYLSAATIDDGSCVLLGCTDSRVANFDPSATSDDGSCDPVVVGCTSSLADNYLSAAVVDSGRCLFIGCTHSLALNYRSDANTDSGLCVFPSPPAFPPSPQQPPLRAVPPPSRLPLLVPSPPPPSPLPPLLPGVTSVTRFSLLLANDLSYVGPEGSASYVSFVSNFTRDFAHWGNISEVRVAVLAVDSFSNGVELQVTDTTEYANQPTGSDLAALFVVASPTSPVQVGEYSVIDALATGPPTSPPVPTSSPPSPESPPSSPLGENLRSDDGAISNGAVVGAVFAFFVLLVFSALLFRKLISLRGSAAQAVRHKPPLDGVQTAGFRIGIRTSGTWRVEYQTASRGAAGRVPRMAPRRASEEALVPSYCPTAGCSSMELMPLGPPPGPSPTAQAAAAANSASGDPSSRIVYTMNYDEPSEW